jgi:uncharacterized protein (DUF2249 family)
LRALARTGGAEFMSTPQTAPDISIDVRELTPRERHPLIFNTYDGLAAGSSMLLINDHDPKPLYYQLKAERENLAGWDYLESGPDTCQFKNTKA